MNLEKNTISHLLADLKENETIAAVKEGLACGDDPVLILDQCQDGILEVGRRYEAGEYYISGLIMGGEIMRQVSELLIPVLHQEISNNGSGKILLATVEKDIHFIGKNLFKVILQCSGYRVEDVGEDASAEDIIDMAIDYSPNIIGLSCLLSSCYEGMHKTISLLREKTRNMDPAPQIIIGGNVNATVCEHVGADGWADDAMIGLRLCQKLIRTAGRNAL